MRTHRRPNDDEAAVQKQLNTGEGYCPLCKVSFNVVTDQAAELRERRKRIAELEGLLEKAKGGRSEALPAG